MPDRKGRDDQLGEVLFEIQQLGNTVKVSAIDPATNTEVSVIGSAHMAPYSLKMNAVRKLKAALRRKHGE
jgi:hypothetical protein